MNKLHLRFACAGALIALLSSCGTPKVPTANSFIDPSATSSPVASPVASPSVAPSASASPEQAAPPSPSSAPSTEPVQESTTPPPPPIPPRTLEVLTRPAGVASNSDGPVALSGDGRFAAFSSETKYDGRAVQGIFVKDLATNTFERVSVSDSGEAYPADPNEPAISGDGRYVAFLSSANGLVPGDDNWKLDAFVRDRVAKKTIRVSVASDGTQGDESASTVAISRNGRHVVFTSDARNLVAGDTNHEGDIFVHDLQTQQTVRVSVSSSEAQANNFSYGAAISADGRFVAFQSTASNLVAGDTNGGYDVFRRDMRSGVTVRASVSSSEVGGNSDSWQPAISDDGRIVAFSSTASNFGSGRTGVNDVYVRDVGRGATERISLRANSASTSAVLSADGRYVAYESEASNLATDDDNRGLDVFLYDRLTDRVQCLSAVSGRTGNGWSYGPAMSSNASRVVFTSRASNLVPGDRDSVTDVYLSELA